jgi:hypothetical protein
VDKIPENIEEIATDVEHTIERTALQYPHEDLVNITRFVNEEIISRPEIERTIARRKIQMG